MAPFSFRYAGRSLCQRALRYAFAPPVYRNGRAKKHLEKEQKGAVACFELLSVTLKVRLWSALHAQHTLGRALLLFDGLSDVWQRVGTRSDFNGLSDVLQRVGTRSAGCRMC